MADMDISGPPESAHVNPSTSQQRANRIRHRGRHLDYEQEALDALIRSRELEDKPNCARLALMDAQVWATLQLARNVKNAE